MSRDLQRVIQVEVTVPRIALPTFASSGDATYHRSPVSESASIDADLEQVRLHVIDTPGQSTPQPAYGMKENKALTYASKRGPFRLFHLRYFFKQGQGLLLQILRHYQHRRAHSLSGENRLMPANMHVDDELICLLEYRSASSKQIVTPIEIIAGIKRVVIMLNEEGIPNSYTIDGSES
ncbi:MAG: hypothetical protein J2P37_29920 [Ktedonobacteraceae bacterium]|nr:hypothetical protein [Ktedonobacteraceae bacterium]